MIRCNIVFGSHTAGGGVFRVGSHHLSREFSRMGNHVSHISTPVSLLHVAKIFSLETRRRYSEALRSPSTDVDGVRQVIPILALPGGSGPAGLSKWNLSHPLKPWSALMPRLPDDGVDILILDQPLLGGLIQLLKPTTIIYRPTDIHFSSVSREAELAILKLAHGVVATSGRVLDAVSDGTDALPSMILENGVEFDRFAPQSQTERKGAVYVGALDARFDWAALSAIAGKNLGEQFRIAGPVDVAVPRDLPTNVKLLGPVPYDSVPALLSQAKVGLLPLSSHQGNAGRSPMKYFEYLASGLAVVATSSPELAQRVAPGVFLYETIGSAPGVFRDALDAYANLGSEGVAYASAFSWQSRSVKLLDFIENLRRS